MEESEETKEINITLVEVEDSSEPQIGPNECISIEDFMRIMQ